VARLGIVCEADLESGRTHTLHDLFFENLVHLEIIASGVIGAVLFVKS
jgi:hypothetical protein